MSHTRTTWDGPTKTQELIQPKRKPLKRCSAKTRAKLPLRRECVEAVRKRSGGYCEARLPGCTVIAQHVHEIVPRSQGGSITDPANCLHLCERDHRWIHNNSKQARKMGLLKDKK